METLQLILASMRQKSKPSKLFPCHFNLYKTSVQLDAKLYKHLIREIECKNTRFLESVLNSPLCVSINYIETGNDNCHAMTWSITIKLETKIITWSITIKVDWTNQSEDENCHVMTGSRVTAPLIEVFQFNKQQNNSQKLGDAGNCAINDNCSKKKNSCSFCFR